MLWFRSRLVPIPPPPLQRLHRFEHYFSTAVKRLIVLRPQTKCPLPFLVPVILSVHMLLGAYFEPAGWIAPVTQYGVSALAYLLNHADHGYPFLHISMQYTFRPLHSQIRQSFIDILTMSIL